MIALDTNVLSEIMRATPAYPILRWFVSQASAGHFTTTPTQAEIFNRLALLPDGQRRDDLVAAARPIFEVELAGRILCSDQSAAMAYAQIAASCRGSGRPITQIAGQIASIPASRGARLAPRNGKDFADRGIMLGDP